MDINKIIVHGGVFHADDALCVAMAKAINPEVTIERAFRVPNELEPGTIVADVGGGKYDHHQADATLREDGHKHAACGLLLEDLKDQLFPDGVPEQFAEIISNVEDLDNGVPLPERNFISDYTTYSNPQWDAQGQEANPNYKFNQAVDNIGTHFLQPFMELGHMREEDVKWFDENINTLKNEREASTERAKEILTEALDNMKNNIVVLDRFVPWNDVLVPSQAELVVFPSNRGGYMLQCVPPELESFDKKVPLPESWLTEKPEGALFVHQGLFIANFDTLEHTLAGAEQVMELNKAIEEPSFDELEAVDYEHETEEDRDEMESAYLDKAYNSEKNEKGDDSEIGRDDIDREDD